MPVNTRSEVLETDAHGSDDECRVPHPIISEPEPKHPKCAVLSQVVLSTPQTLQILPVRIRSWKYNDVAFIGSQSVRICELEPDGHLAHVSTYAALPNKIQDAVVFGHKTSSRVVDDSLVSAFIKTETQSSEPRLPPQLLVLALSSGNLVFLGLTSDGQNWLTTLCEGPQNLPLHIKIRLEIDPSMRYMVMAVHDAYIVYEMNPYQALEEEFKASACLSPVCRIRAQALPGTWLISLVSFLHPRPQDKNLVILLFIIVQPKPTPVTKMVLYDWEHGDAEIFAKGSTSTRLADEHLLPGFVVPLKLGSSFLLVSGSRISFVQNSLSGSPQIDQVEHLIPTVTPRRAPADPLLTAWARPFRHEALFETTDIVYLTREDGTVIYVELEADSVAPDVNVVGHVPMMVDRAFSTAFNEYFDILIIAGEASSGGVWKLSPRKSMEKLSSIDSWSPVLDAGIVAKSTLRVADMANANINGGAFSHDLGRTGRLFSISGGGGRGLVTECRAGLPGSILLDIDLGEPVWQAWVLNKPHNDGFTVILSFPHSTTILDVSNDLDSVSAFTPETTVLDLTCRTLHVDKTFDGTLLQVTENALSLVKGELSQQVWLRDVLDHPDPVADYAHSVGSALVITSNKGDTSKAYVFEVLNSTARLVTSFNTTAGVTCLRCIEVAGSSYILVGSTAHGGAGISLYDGQGLTMCHTVLSTDPDHTTDDQEDALTSFCTLAQSVHNTTLLAGTRTGFLVSLEIEPRREDIIRYSCQRVGNAILTVFPGTTGASDEFSTFMCCGRNLLAIVGSPSFGNATENIYYVWPINHQDRSALSPTVSFVSSVPRSLSGKGQASPFLLVSETSILFTEVESTGQPVPRQINVEGNPYRMIYSRTWDCLVLAVEVQGRSTLIFMDTDTGQQIARPCGKEKETLDYISGLGKQDDRILSLYEWLYVKDSKAFSFLVAGTEQGSFVVISVEMDSQTERTETSRRLQYWTRFRKKHDGPIYSVSGNSDGLVFSSGKDIILEHLDPVQRKFVQVLDPIELDSPAVSLQLANDRIYAMTYSEGLQIIGCPVDIQGNAKGAKMVLLHDDEVARTPFATTDFGSSHIDPAVYPLQLVSDLDGTAACMMVPNRAQRQLREIISMQLTSPIRKFVRAYGRPTWNGADSHRRFGTLPIGDPDSSMFGIGFNGTLYHFTLANEDLARFMSWVRHWCYPAYNHWPNVNNIHTDDEEGRDQDAEGQVPPLLSHVHGRDLEQFLKLRLLDPVVNSANRLDELSDLLKKIGASGGGGDDEDMEADVEERKKTALSQAYAVLGYLMAPSMKPNLPNQREF